MITIVVKGPFAKAKGVIDKAKGKADAFELCLDTFEAINLDEVRLLKEIACAPVIFTLRKKDQGGQFLGTEEERERMIEKLLSLKPDYIDLEYNTSKEFIFKIQKEHPQTKIICSYHNFEKTPQLLLEIFYQMENFQAHIYKLATQAQSTLDSLRMLQFVLQVQKLGKACVGICMGEEGKMTRILGPVIGNAIHYTLLEKEEKNEKGLIPIDELFTIYRYQQLNSATKVYGLIGDPVTQSRSDVIHNRTLAHFGIDALYVKMCIKLDELALFFGLMHDLPIFRGFSVTMPLKEKAIDLCDHLDEKTREIGAVNTLVRTDGKWWGYNTDSIGALNALEEKGAVASRKVLILGAGGAARAVAFEAIHRGAQVTILNRTEDRAKAIAKQFGCDGGSLEQLNEIESYDILINTTSLGMAPNIDKMPLFSKNLLPNTVVMDVITKPRKTRLLEEAEKRGSTLVYGYEMFINQAIEQFALWFGKKTPKSECKKIMQEGF